MTISTTNSAIYLIADGVETEYDFDFVLYDPDTLIVQIGLETVNPTDYTVTIDPGDNTGYVTFATPPENNAVVSLARVIPLTQETEYPLAGAFSPLTHELALDKLTMIAQQTQRMVEEGAQYSPLAGYWETEKQYRRFQIINVDDAKLYSCVTDHISGATFAGDLATGKWVVYVDSTSTYYVDRAESAAVAAEEALADCETIEDDLSGLEIGLNDLLSRLPVPTTGQIGYYVTVESPAVYSYQALPTQYHGNKNRIINGNFLLWQRGSSQSATGYGSDDRWRNDHVGVTKTAARMAFAIGQMDVTDNPRYYARTTVLSAAGAGNYAKKSQRIEGVASLSGKNVVFSFWGKADAVRPVAISFTQNFGTGGAPSAAITGLLRSKPSLTTTWARYTSGSILIPSVSGKTLGTNEDDYLEVNIWFDAGSDFNAQTNTLGQQSGVFDIANVQLEIASSMSTFEERSISEEMLLCSRFYQRRQATSANYHFTSPGFAYSTIAAIFDVRFPFMRRKPTFGYSAVGDFAFTDGVTTFTSVTLTDLGTSDITNSSMQLTGTNGAFTLTTYRPYVLASVSSAAWISFDAEL